MEAEEWREEFLRGELIESEHRWGDWPQLGRTPTRTGVIEERGHAGSKKTANFLL